MLKPVIIYGVPLSQNVRKPLAVAHHLGIAVENRPSRPNEPDVLSVNPNGRIPAMDDNGFRLSESNAIMCYLCSKTDNALYPDDPQQRGQINQWLNWDMAHWTPAYQPIQFERLIKGMTGRGAPDESVIAAALERFKREATYLNKSLAGRDWLVGEAPTLADFAVGAGLTHADAMDLPYKDYANIAAWNERVKALDGFQKTVPSFG